MAELAAGAVSSLLGVIRNEALLLGRVRLDVQFIKEEMESMNSFLAHLARTAPTGGEHDEQVRTWMNQVRLLAQDCNNCIDLYLYRGNPDIHRATGGLRRYVWWLPWFVNKMFAQHQAANQLRELKDRARDVGERRLRYGVEVPAKVAGTKSPPGARLTAQLSSAQVGAPAAAGGDHDDEEEDGDDAVAANHSGPRQVLFGLRVLEDYFNGKLADWTKETAAKACGGKWELDIPCIVVVAPNRDDDADAVANQVLAVATSHFQRSVLVDIPAVHLYFVLLEPEDVLCYILRELELGPGQTQSQHHQGGTSQQGEGKERHVHWQSKSPWGIYSERRTVILKLRKNIQEMKVYKKLEEIKNDIPQVKCNQLQLDLEQKEEAQRKISEEPLDVLLVLLLKSAATVDEQEQGRKEAIPTLAAFYDDIIKETAMKIKEHDVVEAEAGATQPPPIRLHGSLAEYEHILCEVFPKTSNRKPLQAQQQNRIVTTWGEDQIREMIHKAKLEILHDLQERKSDNKEATCKPDAQVQIKEVITEETIPKVDVDETIEKIDKVKRKIRELISNKGIVEKIQNHLNHARTLIIIKINQNYALGWDEMRNALDLLRCVDGVLIVDSSNNNQRAKEYRYLTQQPMEYSLVGLYHDIVLQLTGKQTNGEDIQIFRSILNDCKPHEFCMKIFAHALSANPKRSKEELHKLHSTLQAVSPKSFGRIAKKMLKFSYNDLPKEYKSCLLYLAIFPPGHKIRRSTLIGRWVTEGLITTEDWRWSNSVLKAKQCFDALINRWLIYPSDIGATGEVKCCIVGDQVHKFITMIAEKQRIVETRLSHHLARYFSIFNDLRLRASDTIHSFLNNLSESSQFPLLKVLDLEGCHCFDGKNVHYLKDICCKILLLKYLSLRRTNVNQLPSEINNLHELEVLDIRQTKVPAFATRHFRLLKLKRLLAGHTDPNASITDASVAIKEFPSSVDIPEMVEKMEHMEVLFSVKPQTSHDLKDLGRLWQLRKLGVVVEDKHSHLTNLVEAIGNLNHCIQSLSITVLHENRRKGIHCRGCLLPATNIDSDRNYILRYPPKVLQSLSISGTTEKVQLLKLLAYDNKQLTKVTLSDTSLSQNELEVLLKLPMLHCVRLRQNACTESKLTFKKDEFQNLKYLLVEGSHLTGISFVDGATPELEKIVLPLSDCLKLSGLDKLQRLEELELSNNKSNNIGVSNNGNNIKSSSSNDGNTGSNIITATPTDATAAGAATTAADPVTTATATVTAIANTTNAPANTAHTTATIVEAALATANTTDAGTTTTGTKPTIAANDNTATANTTNTTATMEPSAAANNNTATAATTTNTLFSLLENAKQIAKVTLRGTMLKQGDIQILAKMPNLRCLVLLDKSYDESQLTFNGDEFPRLNLLIVECSRITKISFTAGSSPKLEKFVWTFTNMESLSGIDELPRLKEIEFKGESVPNKVKEDINKRKELYFTNYKLENQDRREGNEIQEHTVAKCPCFGKDKGWR